MKVLILLIVFGLQMAAQKTQDFTATEKVITNLDSDKITRLNQKHYISIVETASIVAIKNLSFTDEEKLLLEYYMYYEKNGSTHYLIKSNKWDVSEVNLSEIENHNYYITLIYNKPNKNIIMYGPLNRQ